MRLTWNCTLRELAGSCTAERLGIDNTPSERVVERLPLQEELRVDVVGFDQRLAGRDRGWFLYGPDTRLQREIAGHGDHHGCHWPQKWIIRLFCRESTCPSPRARATLTKP
jgi:hypothetical protein